MPTYEFVCSDCRKTFSVTMSLAQYGRRRPVKCPKCERSRPVHRKITPFFAQTSKKS